MFIVTHLTLEGFGCALYPKHYRSGVLGAEWSVAHPLTTSQLALNISVPWVLRGSRVLVSATSIPAVGGIETNKEDS